MMTDPTALIALASAGVAGLSVASAAALRGWNGWLELKRLEMTSSGGASRPTGPLSSIEVTDLKARVRKLEAIANGAEY